MIRNILIPTDGSEQGKVALEYALYMAGKLGASLTGLHVVDIRLLQAPVFSDISGSVGLPPYQELLPAVEGGLEARAETILAAFQQRCGEAGVPATARKVMGVIDESIIEAGREADGILLARRGEHFHLGSGGILGSTAEAVVRKAGKPVIVTPDAFREIESMALAYDGSAPARHALSIAAFLSGAAAWPLTVVLITDNQTLAAERMKQVEEALADAKIDAQTIVLPGKEDKALLRFIQEGAVELMVMGAYGQGRLRELFVGSTTSAIIRKSPIPVLLTR
jgi:nucleotide-binding universal stress UspA family protein